MKIISYNVNGIRAALSKGLIDWLKSTDADIVCIQELKATPEQFDTAQFENLGYHCFWNPAVKKGYSGVGLLSRAKPDKVVFGFGKEIYDHEGRVIRADIGDKSFLSLYIPSGSSGDERQDFKMEFLDFFTDWTIDLLRQRPNLVISGDFNICHQAIDIHDPIRNATSSGFLPEEREWFSGFLDIGLTDSFRFLHPKVQKYSWWSFRANSRAKNLGWRIDYHLVSEGLKNQIRQAGIDNDVVHSDHCPVWVELA